MEAWLAQAAAYTCSAVQGICCLCRSNRAVCPRPRFSGEAGAPAAA